MPEPAPSDVNRTVPRHGPKEARRPREYLLEAEVERLMATARRRGGRHGHRDATLILITYLHGLRVAEACALRWQQVDFPRAELHVARHKRGRPAVHLIRGSELRALRRLLREQDPPSPFVFTTERQGPMTPDGVRKLVTRIGQAAALPFPIHPHMLRHACGYELQRAGHPTRVIQAWLGHSDIRHTVRYTELASDAFKEVWRARD